ncbi:DUF4012 domain-containing protein [Microbacterium sp. zg.Y1090]|uniref:DUF4012 domain-containing protein n=1 Tax=Microbacterium TaxID=33882 RepID=UPI00214B06D9|nr:MULTISPECIES: DUF4012 domain-containing protein [unclassified Microbacterium]MCR2811809.1 DUF4012 domain-containing protein [Microbacterium sp. zg.Y1084]MCR2818753.1 DUF4012 domain-containing protein [Microbacterium sp. zg.Y1090]MDL5486843.1 DUF4012 domain-containing protein [Microbacterium sp. zg-Y1211]WIM27072.1 DUF4012 domain-containing protein [Microbacterium sp. zg-Y1090]
MTRPPSAHRTDPVRGAVLASVVMLCLVVAALAWVVVRIAQAGLGLSDAAAVARELPPAIAEGDLGAATDAVRSLSASADRAAQATSDPAWAVAEALPWFGDDLSAVAVLAGHGRALAAAGVELTDAAADLADAPDDDAVVDVAALAEMQTPLRTAAEAASDARTSVHALAPAGLLPPIASGVRALRVLLDEVEPALQSAAAVIGVLPGVLGAEGPHTLLVMIQNNAELRAGGGITGSFALLDADQGVLSLRDQADSSEFPLLTEPIMPVPADTTALYGDGLARFVQNTSMTADFAVTGALASAWWHGRTGTTPDAVLSLDPLVVRALLAQTGPVTLADGTELTAENLVDRVLVEPYTTLDAREQTVFLQSVTDSLFTALTERGMEPLAWMRALADPVATGRVSLWSADPVAQATLDGTALGGSAARHRAAEALAFAVYFNDTTGGKMDVFLGTEIDVDGLCRTDGRPELTVTLTLDSRAPAEAAVLPPSVTGGGHWGVPPGEIGTIVSVAAPEGWSPAGVRRDGAAEPSVEAVEAGFPTAAAQLRLAPGASGSLEFRFVGPPGAVSAPRILHTPMVHAPVITSTAPTCG